MTASTRADADVVAVVLVRSPQRLEDDAALDRARGSDDLDDRLGQAQPGHGRRGAPPPGDEVDGAA